MFSLISPISNTKIFILDSIKNKFYRLITVLDLKLQLIIYQLNGIGKLKEPLLQLKIKEGADRVGLFRLPVLYKAPITDLNLI